MRELVVHFAYERVWSSRGDLLQLTGVKTQWLTKEFSAVDGSWAEWGEWSRCSVLCGIGRRTRDRTCTDPFPSFGGRACPGPGTDLAHCFAGPCKGRSPFSSSSSVLGRALTWLTASLGPAKVDLLLVVLGLVVVVHWPGSFLRWALQR